MFYNIFLCTNKYLDINRWKIFQIDSFTLIVSHNAFNFYPAQCECSVPEWDIKLSNLHIVRPPETEAGTEAELFRLY